MRKILLLLCLLPSVMWANFVELNLQNKNITTTEVVKLFSDSFNVSTSTFVLVNERHDQYGFMHQNYQQYIDGVIVENCMLIVHSKNGYVTIINGDVMPDTDIPEYKQTLSPAKARRISGVHDSTSVELLYLQVLTDSGFISHKAYKVCDSIGCKYINVNSGEVLREDNYVRSSYTCTMPTIYSGTKIVECEKNSNNKYILRDNTKNISVNYGDMGYYYSEPSPSYVYTSSSTNWSNNYLTSVTLTGVRNDWWETLGIGDTYPDLYVTIENEIGAILYTSDYKEDVYSFPITFRFSEAIAIPANGNYKIKIWDDDINSDQLGATITINSNFIGTHTFGGVSSNVSGNFEITAACPAFDAFWGVGKAIDFYQQCFSLNGFDGNGTRTRVFLHRPESSATIKKEGGGSVDIWGRNPYYNYYNNAFASSPSNPSNSYLYFGMGNEDGRAEVGLNTVTHEFTHLVTAYRPNGDLVYQGESGAINEGYSDVMAEVLEYWLYGSCDWKYNTESPSGINGRTCIRDLAHPKSGGSEGSGKPDTYGGTYWGNPSDTDSDHGYVHRNNSIFTYWFYLLSEGGSGTNDLGNHYNIEGIGVDLATVIVWLMHYAYLPAQSTFSQARQWAIQSSRELNLSASDKLEIERSVTNAWYAVGVGPAFVEPITPDSGDSQITSNQYVIVAKRNTSNDGHWYYMTSDRPTSTTKSCYKAVDTGTDNFNNIQLSNLPDSYIWDIVADGNNWKLKNGNQYSTWTSGNTASFDAVGKSLTFDVSGNQILVHFNDGTYERYLSLNSSVANDYFAYYSGTSQEEELYFIPLVNDPEPPVRTDCRTLPFIESFASSQGSFTIENVALDGLNYVWNFASSYGMKASAYVSSVNHPTESWLISPCLELPEDATINLTFDHVYRYTSAPTTDLTLLVSENYVSGAPSTATWTPVAIPTYSSGSNWTFVNAGNIDLSAYAGKYVTLSFRYKSSSSAAATWEIKNISVTSSSVTTGVENVLHQNNATKCIIDGHLFILRDGHKFTATGTMVE